MMLDLVHRGGSAGMAIEGQLSRIMREAGQGGIGPVRRHLWSALGELATGLSSLVNFLKAIGLRIRVGYAEQEGWELACTCELDKFARTEMNSRGIVLKAELNEGGEIPLRVGQCWEIDGKAFELLGYRGSDAEIMEWESGDQITLGCDMIAKEEDRPLGMGGIRLMDRLSFLRGATHLLELSVDKITEKGEGELTCKVMARRTNRAIERSVKTPAYLRKEWAMLEGCEFTHVYTDGSYKEEATWKSNY